MSKPSEKAMQLADIILGGEPAVQDCCAQDDYSKKKMEVAAIIDAHTAAELEAQHRKTWALAMEYAKQECERVEHTDDDPNWSAGKNSGYKLGAWDCAANVIELPCPPIEATKDK